MTRLYLATALISAAALTIGIYAGPHRIHWWIDALFAAAILANLLAAAVQNRDKDIQITYTAPQPRRRWRNL